MGRLRGGLGGGDNTVRHDPRRVPWCHRGVRDDPDPHRPCPHDNQGVRQVSRSRFHRCRGYSRHPYPAEHHARSLRTPGRTLGWSDVLMGASFPGLLLRPFTCCTWSSARLEPGSRACHTRGSDHTLRRGQAFRLLKSLVPPIPLIAAVLGTIFAGIAPPTEAVAVGCFASILLAMVRWEIQLGLMKRAS